LRRREPLGLATRAGCEFDGHALLLDYWRQPVRLTWPELAAERVSDGKPCSTFDQAMLLYYLNCADGAPLAGEWIGYRELPDGAFYHQAYQGYSGNRLARLSRLRFVRRRTWRASPAWARRPSPSNRCRAFAWRRCCGRATTSSPRAGRCCSTPPPAIT
jgi:hypothetical protein